MEAVHDVMIRKLKAHTTLSPRDIEAVRSLPAHIRTLSENEDFVRQGDKPKVSAVVLSGMVGRYHTRGTGARQYLSFHITGDMPDAQALFIERMDHAVCGINKSVIAMIPHEKLVALMESVPTIGFAIWRETLIDAAIFREAITNNSSREVTVRLAHFLCEQYYRARAAGLVRDGSCDLPLSQTQLAETLGSSLTTINRAMQALRRKGSVDVIGGRLYVKDWSRLSSYGDFDPTYLHLLKPPVI